MLWTQNIAKYLRSRFVPWWPQARKLHALLDLDLSAQRVVNLEHVLNVMYLRSRFVPWGPQARKLHALLEHQSLGLAVYVPSLGLPPGA